MQKPFSFSTSGCVREARPQAGLHIRTGGHRATGGGFKPLGPRPQLDRFPQTLHSGVWAPVPFQDLQVISVAADVTGLDVWGVRDLPHWRLSQGFSEEGPLLQAPQTIISPGVWKPPPPRQGALRGSCVLLACRCRATGVSSCPSPRRGVWGTMAPASLPLPGGC